MIGFLVRAAIGGVVAYGVLTVLDKTKVLDKAIAFGNEMLDKAAEQLVKFESTAGHPTSTSRGSEMS